MITLSEWASKERIGALLPRPRERLTTTVEEAVDHLRLVDAAVVAKASGVSHKSERKLVRLGLDEDGLRRCWAELAEAGDGTVLVAEQRTGELELLVGGVRDPQFGPLVTVGLGGVTAEVDADLAFLLAPLETGELERAVSRLRAVPLFFGFRGRTPVDLDALAWIVDAVGQLLIADPRVLEIDCNPVLVDDGRPCVLDALVILSEDGEPG